MEEKNLSIRESLEGIHRVVFESLANVIGINQNYKYADYKSIIILILKFFDENDISVGEEEKNFIKKVLPPCDNIDSIIQECMEQAGRYDDANQIVRSNDNVYFVNQLVKGDKIANQAESAVGITVTYKLVLQDLLQLLCTKYDVDYADSDLCYDFIDEMTDLISEKNKEIDIMVFTKNV